MGVFVLKWWCKGQKWRFQKVYNRPAGANGRSYRGQSTDLVAATLFFRKINCGFRYAFQLGAFFWPSYAPGRGGDWKRILSGVKFDYAPKNRFLALRTCAQNRNKVDSAITTQILSRFLMPAKALGSNLGLAGVFAESKQLSKEGIFASKMAIRATCGRIMAKKKKKAGKKCFRGVRVL